MARILSRFDRADIKALVGLGRFSKPEATEFLSEVLEQRLRKITDRYLTRLSPLSDLRIDGSKLCATDLLRRRGVRDEGDFRYDATMKSDSGKTALRVEPGAEGAVCMDLPPVARGSDPAYVVVTIGNGVAKAPLEAHLYDLGPSQGYKVVGLTRPNP
jgi:hypothetical protein